MSQGNCTLCKHSHLADQLGTMQRVCRRDPPSVIVLPARPGQVQIVSVWPPVAEQMVCDAFTVELAMAS